MALVKYGALITEIKGKVNGQVFQGGNAGFVLRNKNSRPGNDSLSRSAATNLMSQVAGSWRYLSPAERLAWSTAAENWLFVNRYGETYTGSGYQMYCAYNRRLIQRGQSMVLVPVVPETGTDPLAIQLDVAASNFVITWDQNPGASSYYNVYATRLYAASQRQFNRPFYFLGTVTGETGDFDCMAPWVAKFGSWLFDYGISVKVVSADILFPKPSYTYYASGIISQF